MLKLNTKFFLAIFFVSLNLHAGVGENRCTQKSDLPLGTDETLLITSLLNKIDVVKCVGGPLLSVSVTDPMMASWRNASMSFCSKEENSEFCDYDLINPSAPEIGVKLLEYVQSNEDFTSMRANARAELPIFLCMQAYFNDVKDKLFKETITLEDAKKDVDTILGKIDDKLKIVFLKLMIDKHNDSFRESGEWSQLGIDKMSYILDKLSESTPDASSELHTALQEIVEKARYNEDIKFKSLEILNKFGRDGHLPSRVALTTLSNSNSRWVKGPVKEKAIELATAMQSVPLKPDAVTGDPDGVPSGDDANKPVIASTDAAPKCSEWSEDKLNAALYMSESKVSDFYAFFQKSYQIDLSSYGTSEGVEQNSFAKFKELIVPSAENDTAENMKWITFRENYAQENLEIGTDAAKQDAELFYCRMQKIESIYNELNQHPGDKDKKAKLLRLLSQLPSKEAWYIIEKSLDGETDDTTLGNYISLMKRIGGGTAQTYLDKIFLKSNRMRAEVIEAFAEPSIKLTQESEIFKYLTENKEKADVQDFLKRFRDILQAKEADRIARAEKVGSISSHMSKDINGFIESISPEYTPHDYSTKTPSELDADISALNATKSELDSKIALERQRLLAAINSGEGDTSIIQFQLDQLQQQLNDNESKLFSAKIQKRLFELKTMTDPSALELAKSTIIEDLSKFLQGNQSGDTDAGNMAVLLAIKEMVISDANAGSDDPTGGTSSTTGNNGTPTEDLGNGGNPLAGPQIGDNTTPPRPDVVDPEVITDDGRTTNSEVKVPTTPDTSVVSNPDRGNRGGKGTPDIPSDAIIKNNNNTGFGNVNLSNTPAPSPTSEFTYQAGSSSDDETESFDTAENNTEFETNNFEENQIEEVAPTPKRESAQVNVNIKGSGIQNKPIENENFTQTKMDVTTIDDSSKSNTQPLKQNNGLKNEIADLQKEVSNLQVSNAELQNKRLEEKLQETLSSNNNAQQINRNIAAVGPGSNAATVKAGRNPASAPIGEGGSGGSSLAGSGSTRAPSSNNSKLERKVIPEGQIDMGSIGTRFVKDLDEKEAGKMGAMSVQVQNKEHEQHLLSLLSNPETANCSDLKFLDIFFKEHIAKVKFNKQGDAELLVKSGNIPLRVVKPSEKKVEALQEKYCGMAKNKESNSRHTASIGSDLENLPEEGSEAIKPIERKRTESGALGKIIDGIKGFFE